MAKLVDSIMNSRMESEGIFPMNEFISTIFGRFAGIANADKGISAAGLLHSVAKRGGLQNLSPFSQKRVEKYVSATGLNFENYKKSLQHLPHSTTITQDFQKLRSWEKNTGLSSIVYNPIHKDSAIFNELLNHEKIHSAHYGSLNNPFWKANLPKTNLKKVIGASLIKTYDLTTPGELERTAPELLELAPSLFGQKRAKVLTKLSNTNINKYKEYLGRLQADGVIRQSYPHLLNPKTISERTHYESELLAYHHQSNPKFLETAENAGIITPNVAANRIQRQLAKAAETRNPLGWASRIMTGAKKMSKAL